MAIDFFIVNNEKQKTFSKTCVNFDEKLHDYLLEKESDNSFELLLELDLYSDRIFSTKEINSLIEICEALLNKYRKGDKQEQEIRIFSRDLQNLCEKALKQTKQVIAVGD
ncbi:hypothetical protein ABEP17_17915 [Priestia flexa]|uniref:hypothetical protein n=1 Tax=Priestia flexa TaxID=86664 RepID=UPI00211B213A